MNGLPTTTYRFSGHDTFQCRYAWLPKGVKLLNSNIPTPFANDDKAMVSLGVGKNMVPSSPFGHKPPVLPKGRELK